MSLKLANNAISSLSSSISSADTSVSVRSGEGARFPQLGVGDYFPATISKSNGQYEIVRVTARSGDTLTITRGLEGTGALDFDANALIELRLTAETFNSLQFQYKKKTVSENTVLDSNTEYATGSGLRVLNGVKLQIPASTKLVVKSFASGNTF